jgi:nucleoside-diphosphate-sugar epimerase
MTGASSFTGYWLARALAERGHELWLTFRRRPAEYEPLRRRRVESLLGHCQPLWDCEFGSPRFLEAISTESRWDAYCHHGAEVADYRNPRFDAVAATARNTRGIVEVLESLAGRGLSRVVCTGTVFECDEGAGEEPRRAFSPYGLSKALTWQIWRYWCREFGLAAGKFVVPNPFGPLEEPRFTAYLMKTWMSGQKAGVKTPLYVRDNIHVSALAQHYANFAASDEPKLAPSGYIESQGAFAQRFQAAMRPRLNLPCEVEIGEQTDFGEPAIRVNTGAVRLPPGVWSESAAWDGIAEFYLAARGQSA